MASFAFVIGIERYEDGSMPDLETPVEDALRMAAWLVDRGGVEAKNLTILLDPPPRGPADYGELGSRIAATAADLGRPPGWFAGVLAAVAKYGTLDRATKDNILTALAGFPKRTAGGERTYFYYAGHGLMSRVGFANEDAIVPADYAPDVRKPLGVSSIVRFFQPLNFPEQFFFIDCCRNAPLDERTLDTAPPPPPIDLSRPAAGQFVFNATAPGQKALDGRGLLTDLLVAGLLGRGASKDWDPKLGRYAVNVERLFAYIRDGFAAATSPPVLAKLDGKVVIQQPRLGGEHTTDPVVVTYPDEAFADVPLTLDVAPPSAQLILLAAGTAPTILAGLPGAAHVLTLRPRSYHVAAIPGAGWKPSNVAETLELFAAAAWSVAFDAIPPPAEAAPAPAGPDDRGGAISFDPTWPPAGAGAGGGAADMDDAADLGRDAPAPDPAPIASFVVGPGDPAWPGQIVVDCDDPLARVVLDDLQGDGRAAPGDAGGFPRAGFGSLVAANLAPGFYRISVRTPGGAGEARTVHLAEGEGISVRLVARPSAPTPAPARPAPSGGGVSFDVAPTRGDGGPPTGTGGAAGPVVGRREEQLRILLAAAAGPTPAIHVVAAVETARPGSAAGAGAPIRLDSPGRIAEYLRAVRFQLRPIDEAAVPPGSSLEAPATTDRPEIVRFSRPAPVGVRWLRVELEGTGAVAPPAGPGVDLALPFLDGWRTGLLLHQEDNGRITASLLMLPGGASRPEDVAAARRVDRAQQFWADGQLAAALALLEVERAAARPDPIGGCLLGYLLLRARRFDDLGHLAAALVDHHPDLPDAHVLVGFCDLVAGGRGGAAPPFRAALDRGLPITGPLLKVFAAEVAAMGLRHDRLDLLARAARRLLGGSIWTANAAGPE